MGTMGTRSLNTVTRITGAQGKMVAGGPLRALALALALMSASDAFAAAEQPVGVYCRRHAGFAVGAVYAPGTWERIGKSPFFATASPIVAGACALDMGPVSVALGSELQFTYVHYDRSPDKSLSTGWLTVSAAVTAGTDQLRGGVYVAGALVPVGAGLELDWLPGNPHRTRDGLQAKLTGFWVEKPNFQLMVNYTVAMARIP